MNNSSHKYITSTGLVYTGATELYSASLTAGSDAATLTLRDFTDTTGGVNIIILKTAANTTVTRNFRPIKVKAGIYATLTGTSATATLELDGNFTTTSTSTSTTTTSTSTSTS